MEKSRIYQLYELRDELKKAKAAIIVKNESQRLLVKIILEAKQDVHFQNLIKATNDELKNDELQILNINTRLEDLDYVIKLHEKRDENSELVNEIVTRTLNGLGLVQRNKKEESK